MNQEHRLTRILLEIGGRKVADHVTQGRNRPRNGRSDPGHSPAQERSRRMISGSASRQAEAPRRSMSDANDLVFLASDLPGLSATISVLRRSDPQASPHPFHHRDRAESRLAIPSWLRDCRSLPFGLRRKSKPPAEDNGNPCKSNHSPPAWSNSRGERPHATKSSSPLGPGRGVLPGLFCGAGFLLERSSRRR